MSFQAYLDKVEEITGKTPNDFIALAKKKNLTQHKDIIAWLKKDYGLGLGHARAIAYVIQHGPKFTVRQTSGPHRVRLRHPQIDRQEIEQEEIDKVGTGDQGARTGVVLLAVRRLSRRRFR